MGIIVIIPVLNWGKRLRELFYIEACAEVLSDLSVNGGGEVKLGGV